MGASRSRIDRYPFARVLFGIDELPKDTGIRGEMHIRLHAFWVNGEVLLEKRHGLGEVALLVLKTRGFGKHGFTGWRRAHGYHLFHSFFWRARSQTP